MQKARVGIAIAGAVLFVVGVIMIPMPGPGFPIAGLGMVLLVVWTILVVAARASEPRPEV